MFQYMGTEVTPKQSQAIILIHGLVRTARSMQRLAAYLNEIGYDCYLYSYASAKLTIVKHSHELLDNLLKLFSQNTQQQFSFITHSLGGIMARDALSKMTADQLTQVDNLILLTPPNQGSKLAEVAVTAFPFFANKIKPLADLSHKENAYVHQVQTPKNIHIGVIAARLDTKTPPKRTHLKEQNDFIIVTTTHTHVMNHPRVRRAIVNFLAYGAFGSPGK